MCHYVGMLTLNKIAKLTGIPASSIRYYADNFNSHLPHQQDKKTKQVLYEDGCIEIMQFIREQQEAGKRGAEITAELDSKYPTIDMTGGTNEQEPNKQNNNNLLATINTQSVLLVNENVRMIGSQLKTIHRQNDLLEVKDKEIERLVGEVERQKAEISRLQEAVKSEQKANKELSETYQAFKRGDIFTRIVSSLKKEI